MNELPNLIDYSTSDFVKWQEEREAMRQENKRLRKTLRAIMSHAETHGWHAWDTHAEYRRMARAGMSSENEI